MRAFSSKVAPFSSGSGIPADSMGMQEIPICPRTAAISSTLWGFDVAMTSFCMALSQTRLRDGSGTAAYQRGAGH
ncbi:MAG: hypothetical protein ACO38W_06270, partial [Phycisphaerales bacterium]